MAPRPPRNLHGHGGAYTFPQAHGAPPRKKDVACWYAMSQNRLMARPHASPQLAWGPPCVGLVLGPLLSSDSIYVLSATN